MYCPYCDQQIADTAKFCPNCGAAVARNRQEKQNPVYDHPVTRQPDNNWTTYEQPAYQQQFYQNRRPENVSIGGLIAWSVITLLLCTIPGIVALIYTCGINSCETVEQQNKKIAAAKGWCLAGTILGGLSFLGTIAAALA